MTLNPLKMTKKVKFPYQCKVCEGDNLIKCPKCEGKGTYNPYSAD